MKVVGGLAQMWGHEGFANQLLCRDSGAAPNSFAHDSPNNPGLRATRCPRSLLWYHRTCLSQPEVSSARWLSRHSAPPSCLDPREQPPIMLNFVFQGLPLWGGPQGQPRLSSQIIVYARKPGIQVFLMIWVLILFLLRLTRYSYDDSSIMLF